MNASNIEILAYEHTALGPLCLRRRRLLAPPHQVVTEVTLDHEYLMSSINTASERALARIALDLHEGSGLSVLVGGLGLGYTASEALASGRVGAVTVVEFLEPVIDWLRGGLFPLAPELNGDRRLQVVSGDVYRMLADPPSHRCDLILIDVDHSPEDRLDTDPGRFYTEPGLNAARRHLLPGGVLGIWSYAESSPFADALRAVFEDVRVEPITFRNELTDTTETDWLFFARN